MITSYVSFSFALLRMMLRYRQLFPKLLLYDEGMLIVTI